MLGDDLAEQGVVGCVDRGKRCRHQPGAKIGERDLPSRRRRPADEEKARPAGLRRIPGVEHRMLVPGLPVRIVEEGDGPAYPAREDPGQVALSRSPVAGEDQRPRRPIRPPFELRDGAFVRARDEKVRLSVGRPPGKRQCELAHVVVRSTSWRAEASVP